MSYFYILYAASRLNDYFHIMKRKYKRDTHQFYHHQQREYALFKRKKNGNSIADWDLGIGLAKGTHLAGFIFAEIIAMQIIFI